MPNTIRVSSEVQPADRTDRTPQQIPRDDWSRHAFLLFGFSAFALLRPRRSFKRPSSSPIFPSFYSHTSHIPPPPPTHTSIMKLLTKEEEDAHYRYVDSLTPRATSNPFRIFHASCHTNNPDFPTAPSSRAAPSVALLVLLAVQRASCSLRDDTTQSAT